MTLRLDRMSAQFPIVDPKTGKPTQAEQRRDTNILERIEGSINDLTDLVLQIQAAQKSADARMSDVPDVTITADYTGAVDPAVQLPKTIRFYRNDGATDVSSSATWSVSSSAGITCSIGTDGLVTMTDITTRGTITAQSIHNSITLSRTINVDKTNSDAPATGTGGGGGTGGTTATDTSFASIGSATHAAISDELTVIVGSGGEVQLAVELTVFTASTGSGSFPVYGIWRQWDGASYVDVGTEVSSAPDCLVVGGEVTPGQLTVSPAAITGLTPAATEKFQLYARNASGTRSMYFSGSASAVAS